MAFRAARYKYNITLYAHIYAGFLMNLDIGGGGIQPHFLPMEKCVFFHFSMGKNGVGPPLILYVEELYSLYEEYNITIYAIAFQH